MSPERAIESLFHRCARTDVAVYKLQCLADVAVSVDSMTATPVRGFELRILAASE
jgi:hypothetical protein